MTRTRLGDLERLERFDLFERFERFDLFERFDRFDRLEPLEALERFERFEPLEPLERYDLTAPDRLEPRLPLLRREPLELLRTMKGKKENTVYQAGATGAKN